MDGQDATEETRKEAFVRSPLRQNNLKYAHGYLDPYGNIQQELSSGSMQDLHQVANALFPDVEGMLPG